MRRLRSAASACLRSVASMDRARSRIVSRSAAPGTVVSCDGICIRAGTRERKSACCGRAARLGRRLRPGAVLSEAVSAILLHIIGSASPACRRGLRREIRERSNAKGSTKPTPEETMLARLKCQAIAASLLAAASVAAFLTPTQAQTPSGQPITIGFGMALTGPLAGFGKQALLGMKIWEEETNAKGGLL